MAAISDSVNSRIFQKFFLAYKHIYIFLYIQGEVQKLSAPLPEGARGKRCCKGGVSFDRVAIHRSCIAGLTKRPTRRPPPADSGRGTPIGWVTGLRDSQWGQCS